MIKMPLLNIETNRMVLKTSVFMDTYPWAVRTNQGTVHGRGRVRRLDSDEFLRGKHCVWFF